MPGLRRIAFAATVAFSVGLTAIVLMQGFSESFPLRLLEAGAVAVAATAIFGGIIVGVMSWLADWREPEGEAEFEEVVLRTERLARDGVSADPEEYDFLDDADPLTDDGFEELVRDALDDLPDLLRNALRHVAVVVSDQGRRHRAYGLYMGDGPLRDNVPDRIVIFRDTLRRDFGHDPEALREQVTRTVRHELAHHVGFDEMGVQGLGL
jgi:predicted Zn-dependent protease with MMP-like domain